MWLTSPSSCFKVNVNMLNKEGFDMNKFQCKNKLHLCTSELVILLCFVIVPFFSVSCGNSSKKNTSSADNQMEANLIGTDGLDEIAEESIDIPIAINLIHTEDEDMKQLVDAEYEITTETDNAIFIDINSTYYKQYKLGTRFKVDKLAFFENSENVEYLTLNLDVVNNTNDRLSINELNIIVESSKPDTLPIVYICTTQNYSNCLYFVNESWFNWKGFTFMYSIIGKDESFSGEYKKNIHIPYFDNYTIIDFLPDMREMGYDFDGLVENIRNRNIRHNRDNNTDWDIEPLSYDEHENYLGFSITKDDEDFSYFKDLFSPFELKKDFFDEYVGSATLYGSIKFDDSDFKVDFIAEISLSTSGGFGAMSYENDKFDVKLKSSGEDYMLRFPYTTVIEPYGAEMIKLSVKADKSSSHKFHIDIKNDNGLKIKSKDIHFHHYYPQN